MNRISSIHQVIACVFLIVSAVVSSSSQTNPEKTASASISGKVTLKKEGIAGIVVFAHEQNVSGWQRSGYRGTTDQTGSYRITNLPAGTYVITPVAPSLAIEDEMRNTSVFVSEGEAVEDINFALVRGGAITGKITDADGKPLIEEHITVYSVDSLIVDDRLIGSIRTDDRGIYRAFGLRRGKYKVSVGQQTAFPGNSRPSYRQTFYPSVTDAAKATLIEVTEGSETTNVDIVVGRPLTTFKVTGRVVDAETGKPLANVKYGVYQRHGDSGSSSSIGSNATNVSGEFRLENVGPGKYGVFVVPEGTGIRGDSVSFEVVDRDIADLVIKAGKAASASGIVVFESGDDTGRTIKLSNLYINGWVDGPDPNFGGGFSQPLSPDGSFTVNGLRKGRAHFAIVMDRRSDPRPVEVVRVERDGVVQPGGLILKDGEQVTGLRLVVKLLTGGIRGEVKVEGDELLPNARLSIWLSRVDENGTGYQYMSTNSSPQLDSRKRFMVGGLAAGTYEVNLAVFEPGRQDSNRIYKQQVTVADNAVSDVTIVIKRSP